MAFDGMMMSQIKYELQTVLKDALVSQVHQPNRDEILIAFRTFTGTKRLLISTRADTPRVNITQNIPENPVSPPMLCMLMRKRLSGARLVDIKQPENERILLFVFDAVNEIGDREKVTLIVEIMGKYSNMILTDNEDNVIDALKRVDISMSKERLILPKMRYEFPKKQDKYQLLESTADMIVQRVNSSGIELSKALLSSIQGISPVVTREIEYRVSEGSDLKSELLWLYGILKDHNGVPVMLIREDGSPFDISFLDINQYGNSAKIRRYDSYSLLLDDFYRERDRYNRMKAKTQNLNRLLNNTLERLSKKINIQKIELEKCRDREKYRVQADLLQANLYRIEKGAESVEVDNFYDPEYKKITIKLNPAYSPAMNAQKLYKAYAKAKNGEIEIAKQIKKAQDDLLYIESVIDTVSRIETEKELSAVRQELVEEGYIKEQKGQKKQNISLPPLEYSVSGYRVLVGRNNRQNDVLTLKYAKKSDIWLHTKEIPGSHVIIETNGQDVDDEVIYEAASIAVYHSKGRNGVNIPVDYTKVKNVSKPTGAKPGKVIYVNYKTMYADPKDIKE